MKYKLINKQTGEEYLNIMNNEEIENYNRLCAEFLGWEQYLDVNERFYGDWKPFTTLEKPWSIRVEKLFFHSDWNWIMDVAEAIEKLGYESLTGGSEYYYPEKGMRYIQSFIKDDITIYQEAKTKKEAVVQAINQFLIWYNNQKS